MPKMGRNELCHCGSGLKYKRCHVHWDRNGADAPTSPGSPAHGAVGGYGVYLMGERPNPFIRQNWQTPNGIITTADPMEVFDARLAPFTLESIVSMTGSLTRRYFRGPEKFRKDLTKAGLEGHTSFAPFLLRRLVTHAISRRQFPADSGQEVSADWLARAERVLFDAMSNQDAPGGVESMTMRTLQDQYHDQSGYETYIRELSLNLATIRRCLARGLDLEAAYLGKFGLTYSELAFFSFAAYATIMGENSTGALDQRTWLTSVGQRLRLRDGAVESYFDLCSLSLAAFREQATRPHLSEPGFEPYALSPLIYSPLIQRSNGTCVAPIARDLLERPTRSFLIDALRSTPESAIGILSDSSGEAYEQYVGDSLRAVLPDTTFRGSDFFPRSGMNCDFVCVEDGEDVLLVEAKSARLRLRADVSKDRAILKEELKQKRVAHGLAQLDYSARQVRAGETQFRREARVVGMLVVRGELVLLNWPLIRSVLEELCLEESGFSVTVEYQLVNDESFSDLIRLRAEGSSISAALMHKVSDPYRKGADFQTLLKSVRPTALPPHPLRSKQFDEFAGLLERFGVDDLSEAVALGDRSG